MASAFEDSDRMTREMTCRMASAAMALFATTAFVACDSSASSSDPAAACVTGETQPCPASCGSTGVQVCISGSWGQCQPPVEKCNQVDDDCDGEVDEGAVCGGPPTPDCAAGDSQACVTSCSSVGSQACTAGGEWGACQPPAEKCNQVDDDCDGATDEDQVCGVQGECTPGETRQCVSSCATSGKETCSPAAAWGCF